MSHAVEIMMTNSNFPQPGVAQAPHAGPQAAHVSRLSRYGESPGRFKRFTPYFHHHRRYLRFMPRRRCGCVICIVVQVFSHVDDETKANVYVNGTTNFDFYKERTTYPAAMARWASGAKAADHPDAVDGLWVMFLLLVLSFYLCFMGYILMHVFKFLQSFISHHSQPSSVALCRELKCKPVKIIKCALNLVTHLVEELT
jgi:GT2 family glycosyltransferase